MSIDTHVDITVGEMKGLRSDFEEKLASENGREWMEAFKLFLKKQNPWEVIPTVIGSERNLKTMIALGHYDWVSSDITKARFPMPEDLVLGSDPKLFHLDRNISSENAVREMEKAGYRPATIWDLLDFGAKNPEEQRKYPIVALGSVVPVLGERLVAYLHEYGSRRYLDLHWFVDDWLADCRFLAVRK